MILSLFLRWFLGNCWIYHCKSVARSECERSRKLAERPVEAGAGLAKWWSEVDELGREKPCSRITPVFPTTKASSIHKSEQEWEQERKQSNTTSRPHRHEVPVNDECVAALRLTFARPSPPQPGS